VKEVGSNEVKRQRNDVGERDPIWDYAVDVESAAQTYPLPLFFGTGAEV
jgi:hypothetical protein